MEITERIVESYCRYVKHWFTLPNVRCPGQYEIDLLAIDTSGKRLQRYHVECGVSVSGGFSKLTAKPFSLNRLRTRLTQAGARRTFGYFLERKFGVSEVLGTLELYGFRPGNYEKVIVSWGWISEAADLAAQHQITLWDFRSIVREIAETFGPQRSYFTDDTLRTIHLFNKALKETR